MFDKEEFKKSPRFAELTAQAKAVLDANPDYIQAVSEREEARDWYRDMENQFEECDEEMANAELDEDEAVDMDEIDEARDRYHEAEQLKEESDQNMAQAELDEAKAEDKMHKIEKKVIYNLISDPDEAEAVYYYYY